MSKATSSAGGLFIRSTISDVEISFFLSEGDYIAAEPVEIKFKDEDDCVFCEVMTSGEADFLITGNLAHFPKDAKIVRPADFLKAYGKS